MKKDKTILVSGGFDPVHIGHLRMFEEAKKLGTRLIVILNNDNFLMRKKGFIFMEGEERKEIIEGFSVVDEVFISIDEDLTVCKSIKHLSDREKINIFANGGDRRNVEDIPEFSVCEEQGIQMVFDIGGGKIQSSSNLVNNETDKPWGSYRTYEKKKNYLLKTITVDPGHSLSLQSHNNRSEFWVVAYGEALVSHDEKTCRLRKGEFVEIPVKSKHRLENDTNDVLHLVELQFGSDLREDDIIRYEDNYGR